MKLALFRHGEKESEWTSDPLLSWQGEQQAKALKQAVDQGHLPKPTRLIASPKIRTSLTFSPLARSLNLALEKSENLDERSTGEDFNHFKKRISKTIESFAAHKEETVFICSHLDWIEEFSNLVPCDTDLHQIPNFHWVPAAYLIFDIQVIWHLTQKGRIL